VAIASFVREQLTGVGVTPDVFAPRRESPNLVAAIGAGGRGAHLVVNCHLDTFPPAEGRWSHGGPYSGVIEDGRLYGCGASDMRAGVGIALFLASLIKQYADDLPGRLTLTFVSDEESGGRWGSEWLLENVPAVRGDACLVGDQCGTELVGVAEKGFCRVTVTTKGSSSHAAYGTDDSATHRLVRVLTAIRALEDTLAVGRAYEALADRVTVNIGTLSGGVAPNLVADTAAASVEIRMPSWLSARRLLTALEDAVSVTDNACELQIQQVTEPSATPADSRIVQTTLAAVEAATGQAAQPFTRIGASDARLFRARNIPSVVYGPAANNMGSTDEYVTCSEILTTARVHAAVMLAYLEDERPSSTWGAVPPDTRRH
jgi:succinyl-diaminopimelate desuccinylase